MPGGGVDEARVAAAFTRSTPAITVDARVIAKVHVVVRVVIHLRLELDAHQDRVPPRIGEVVRRDPVASALRRASHLAIERARVGRLHRVGHVARLQVSEGAPVGHHELQGFDIGVIGGRVIGVAQNPVRDGEPDLRRRVPGGAEAVLPRQVEMRQASRSIQCRPRRPPGDW